MRLTVANRSRECLVVETAQAGCRSFAHGFNSLTSQVCHTKRTRRHGKRCVLPYGDSCYDEHYSRRTSKSYQVLAGCHRQSLTPAAAWVAAMTYTNCTIGQRQIAPKACRLLSGRKQACDLRYPPGATAKAATAALSGWPPDLRVEGRQQDRRQPSAASAS